MFREGTYIMAHGKPEDERNGDVAVIQRLTDVVVSRDWEEWFELQDVLSCLPATGSTCCHIRIPEMAPLLAVEPGCDFTDIAPWCLPVTIE